MEGAIKNGFMVHPLSEHPNALPDRTLNKLNELQTREFRESLPKSASVYYVLQ
jgi:hypothetical protein